MSDEDSGSGIVGSETASISVAGTVQGVGFRPAVWRWAQEAGLVGWTRNTKNGLEIRITGAPSAIDQFMRRLRTETPSLARIETIVQERVRPVEGDSDFRILVSEAGANQTQVAPDAAMCADCARETLDPSDRRHGYPFNNCVHCGPRFSILRGTPWDRERTTMSAFSMCASCASEFRDPGNRRFHAQPIACPECGPQVWLERWDQDSGRTDRIAETAEAVSQLVSRIKEGFIVGIQGVGGFHIACDATNERAVSLLRVRKRRFGKPFAMMARDLQVIARYAAIESEEKRALESAEAPIVLLSREETSEAPLASSVAPGTRRIGFMLPYTPLHLLILHPFDIPLVMTSGNRSEEPQVIHPDDARNRLMGIVDYALTHDRAIENRVDDSVVRVRRGKRRMVRRARGYAPSPIRLPEGFEGAPELVALGAELKSTFCLIRSNAAILSQSGGDLENPDVFDEFERGLNTFLRLYNLSPHYFVLDAHPEYLSRKLGLERAAARGTPVMEARHHHAHIASCMVDNGLARNVSPVFGVALDGLGFGDDATFWGGEVLVVTYDSYLRLGGLKPIAMPGGALSVQEPWRNAFAHLLDAIGWEEVQRRVPVGESLNLFDGRPIATLRAMIERGVNAPLASSCGRLFDAVAAVVGIHPDRVDFEAQAAIALERLAEEAGPPGDAEHAGYTFGVRRSDCGRRWMLDPGEMWRGLLRDLDNGVPREGIALRFHLGIARGFVTLVERIRCSLGEKRPDKTVVFSGGCCENALLIGLLRSQFENLGYRCLEHARVPSNDGGLALGQAAIAAAKILHCGTECGRR